MQPTVSPSAVIEELERINSHPLFARADRLRRFLRHSVQRTLEGQTDTLKESLLGQEVFDRGSHFDPKADPIVRIDARRLRRRLAEYYEGPGSTDPIRITLDPGSYVPQFRSTSPARERTVAILPFRAVSPDPESTSLAQEAGEAIHEVLTHTPGVRLMASHSVLQWSEAGTDYRRFGIDVVVSGEVRTQGEQIQVSIIGIDTTTGRPAWTREFGGRITEWFALQEEVGRGVALALRTAESRWKRPRMAPPNRGAYQAFLRGKHELVKASPEGLPTAERHFRDAIQQDPLLAGAWAGLADIYSTLGLFLNQSRSSMVAESLRCARQALSIDPDQPDALVVMGRIQALEKFDVGAALATFTRVLDTQGEHVRARLHRAIYCLASRGDLEEAEGEVESVIEIDPLNMEAQFAFGQVLYFQRRFDEAMQIFRTLIELAPSFAPAYFAMALTCLSSGRLAELASAHSQQLARIPYPLVDEWGEALQYHFAGASDQASATLDRMEAMAAAGADAPTVMADICMRLGRLDRAVEWLERAWETRNFRMLHLRVDPAFDPLRQSAAFQQLISRLDAGTPFRRTRG